MEYRRMGVWLAVTAIALTGGVASVLAEGSGHDWPQFRGPSRDGISAETGLLSSWPETGPKEVWRRPIGEGYSAISVVGNRLYTMYATPPEGEEPGVEMAAAFDADSGDEIWSTAVGTRLETEFGHGPRATPTVDGDSVYVLGAHGELAALDTKDGKVRWQLAFEERFGASRPHWGFSTSPLIDGDRLLIEAGGAEGKSYVALDKKTGETIWTAGDAGAGYNSILPVEMGGERRYVLVSGTSLLCIDADGATVWEHEWPAGETHAIPILVAPNRIYASGAQGVGAQLVEVEEGETVTVTQKWHTERMKNHFSAAVLHQGHLFGFDNATLKAISVDDAAMAWGKRGLGKGSLILADGHLIVLSDRGKLLLVEATDEGYVEKGSVQALEGRSWTAPVLSHGRLYLRNHEEMVVYDLRG